MSWGQKKGRRGQIINGGSCRGGGGVKTRRDKRRSGQVSVDFSGRMERRGECIGDRRRGEEARDHQWELMKGGGGLENQKG
jgi:hypothetical protein